MTAQRRAAGRLLAAAVAVQLLAGGSAAPEPAPIARTEVRAAPGPRLDDREQAVRALLDARGAALLARDRDGFLAAIDPAATAFRARQAAVFDALAQVPVARWEYQLDADADADADAQRSRDGDLDRRFGQGWWALRVDLRVALAGVPVPARLTQSLVLVPRADRWRIAADDAFAALGEDSDRGIWDFGPVRVVRGRSSLVLGHPGSEPLLRELARLADAAVPKVSAAWRRPWPERVLVLVPDSTRELARLVGTATDLSRMAAVATAEVRRDGAAVEVLGERVVVNPGPFRKLGPLGRRVVVAHEVAHVATRAETGPATPTWLVEGFADWIAYADVRVPVPVAAGQVRDAVRAGRGPRGLPDDAAFDGRDAGVSAVYETSWLAVSHLAERHGADRLRALYLDVGASPATSEVAVRSAFRSVLGTTPEAFVRDWLRSLEERFR